MASLVLTVLLVLMGRMGRRESQVLKVPRESKVLLVSRALWEILALWAPRAARVTPAPRD